jgi:hypothetical protein
MMQCSGLRAATGRAAGRVRPFTSASTASGRVSVVVRAAAPEVEGVEGLSALDLITDAQVSVERVALDDDARLAARVAEDVLSTYPLEAQVEALLDGASAQATAKASTVLEDGLEASRGRLPASLSAAAALAATELPSVTVDDVEDYQGAAGFRKYDEEERPVLSDDAQAAVERLKLTRQELANLVPADWASVNVEWFSNKKEDNIPLPEYKLTFLWRPDNILVAVDQVYARGQTSPLTEYFIWPRKDAWEELRAALTARPYVSERCVAAAAAAAAT